MPNSSYVNSSAQVEALSATGLSWTQMFPPPAVMNTALATNGDMTISIPFTHSYIWFMTLFLASLNSSSVEGELTPVRIFYVDVPGYIPTSQQVELSSSLDTSPVVELEYYGTVPDFVSLLQGTYVWGPLVNAMEIFEVSENQMAILTNQQDSKSSTKSQNANFTLTPDNCSN
jgi:hypothetical protein